MGSVGVVLVAGGRGVRFGGDKLLAKLTGVPVLERTLAFFEDNPDISRMVLVLRAGLPSESYQPRFPKLEAVVPGGQSRQESAAAGLAALAGSGSDIVLVHDAVRPLVSRELVGRVIAAALERGAAAPVLPLEDTIKMVRDGRISGTADRRGLARVQTPQGFRRKILAEALRRAEQEGFRATDEAALVERMGGEVATVPGEARNLKITTPEDLLLAEALLETQNRHRV